MFQRLILKVSNEQGINYVRRLLKKFCLALRQRQGRPLHHPLPDELNGRLGVHGMAPTKSPQSVPFQPVTVAVAHVRISQ